MTLVTTKWSLEDYHRMIDAGLLDERQVELIEGEILEMAPEGAGHSYNGRELGKYLRLQLGTSKNKIVPNLFFDGRG
jgi:Uma2 family endonuclease